MQRVGIVTDSTVCLPKELIELYGIQVEKVRTKSRAIERIIALAKQSVEPGKPIHVAVFHANAAEDAKVLKERVQILFPCVELFVTEFTPVMGIHSGPGVVGLAFYAES